MRRHVTAPRAAAALAAITLVACGGKNPAAPSPAAGSTPYAGVFVDRTATYRYQSLSSMHDPDDPRADASGNVEDRHQALVRCTTATGAVDGWRTADISCELEAASGDVLALLVGTFVAGPGGLWRLEAGATADAATLAALAEEPPLLAVDPVEREEGAGTVDQPHGTSHAVRRQAGGWCIHDASWGGDESSRSICIDPARGITRVAHTWAGGSSRESSLELVE